MMRYILIILLPFVAVGCNLLELPAYVLFGQSSKSVKAQYKGLKGTKTAIIIATGLAADFEYPNARMNVALASAQAIGEHVKKVEFVDATEIDTFQEENIDWAAIPFSSIGSKFDVQRILYLDIYQFTLYEENSINLLRGRISAAVRVYEMDSPNPDQPAYRDEIIVLYPEGYPMALSDAAMQNVHFNTITIFADQLAKKFYNHKIPIK